MMLLALAMAADGLGTPFPHAAFVQPPQVTRCMSRYQFTANAPLDQVADFYMKEAAHAGVPALGNTGQRFPDYRMLVFVKQPRFLSVVLSQKAGVTTGRVSFHDTIPAGC